MTSEVIVAYCYMKECLSSGVNLAKYSEFIDQNPNHLNDVLKIRT